MLRPRRRSVRSLELNAEVPRARVRKLPASSRTQIREEVGSYPEHSRVQRRCLRVSAVSIVFDAELVQRRAVDDRMSAGVRPFSRSRAAQRVIVGTSMHRGDRTRSRPRGRGDRSSSGHQNRAALLLVTARARREECVTEHIDCLTGSLHSTIALPATLGSAHPSIPRVLRAPLQREALPSSQPMPRRPRRAARTRVPRAREARAPPHPGRSRARTVRPPRAHRPRARARPPPFIAQAADESAACRRSR